MGRVKTEDWNIPSEIGSPEDGNREKDHDPNWRWVVLEHFLQHPIPEIET